MSWPLWEQHFLAEFYECSIQYHITGEEWTIYLIKSADNVFTSIMNSFSQLSETHAVTHQWAEWILCKCLSRSTWATVPHLRLSLPHPWVEKWTWGRSYQTVRYYFSKLWSAFCQILRASPNKVHQVSYATRDLGLSKEWLRCRGEEWSTEQVRDIHETIVRHEKGSRK